MEIVRAGQRGAARLWSRGVHQRSAGQVCDSGGRMLNNLAWAVESDVELVPAHVDNRDTTFDINSLINVGSADGARALIFVSADCVAKSASMYFISRGCGGRGRTSSRCNPMRAQSSRRRSSVDRLRSPVALAIVAAVLLAAGIVLAFIGMVAEAAMGVHGTRTIAEIHPSAAALWLLVVGVACGLAGIITLGARRST